MKLTQIFLLLAVSAFCLLAFTPQETQGSKRMLLKAGKAGLLLLLLKKGGKKVIFPFPIPLPIPIPIIKERVPVAEVQKVSYAEPVSYAESYGGSYGGGYGGGYDGLDGLY